jgi:hypothetical protein
MRGSGNQANLLYRPRDASRLTRQTSPQEKEARLPCLKCKDSGWYHYDETHAKPCEQCCQCDEGWWLLEEGYAGYKPNQNTWSCLKGCGNKITDKELDCSHQWQEIKEGQLGYNNYTSRLRCQHCQAMIQKDSLNDEGVFSNQ